MEKNLDVILTALLNAQNYVRDEMKAICDDGAMDDAKECYEELEEAIASVRKIQETTGHNDQKQNRVWVGYQVKTKNDDFVPPYTDKDVFRSIEDAENFIRDRRTSVFVSEEARKNMIVVSRWLENDDEEKRNFTFHGMKKRSFNKNERVWDDEICEWVNVRITTYVTREDENVPLLCGNKKYSTPANYLYQVADGKTCPRCGNPLCAEYHDHIDYPYYCPDCQENFYNMEVK